MSDTAALGDEAFGGERQPLVCIFGQKRMTQVWKQQQVVNEGDRRLFDHARGNVRNAAGH